MWYFSSPKIIFGEDALSHLETLSGQRAFIVSDANLVQLGVVAQVQARLATTGIESVLFTEVEPDPSLQTARRCAAEMSTAQPDWIVGLGGGSCLDTAKAAWLLYEQPEVAPEEISPLDDFELRIKARLIAIPTTSGTGAEVTMATVLTDTTEGRKLGLAAYELVPDIAIVDPSLVMALPPQITADTGMDALTHAIEGYTSSYHNDFCDGLCFKAIQLVFSYLPRAYTDGSDAEAREHMHNAATVAGLGFGNAMAALAHAMGHALGGLFHVPHGRAVGLFLPYTIAFTARANAHRYADIAHFLRLPAANVEQGTHSLLAAIQELQAEINQPTRLSELDIPFQAFEEALPKLIAHAESDTSLVMSARIPDSEELEKLFRYAYIGQSIDF